LKKETRLLKAKALSSLLLGVEHFNRPWDVGRTDAVLIFLDHSFEMLLKAAILQRTVKFATKAPRIQSDLMIASAEGSQTVKSSS
jgi:hypothetical protein